jgi:hypothetical protein
MAREELLAELNKSFGSLLEAVAGLSDEQMAVVWYDDWSVNDILAHVAGWHREMAPAFERIARGERPVPEDTDYSDFNKWNAGFAGSRAPTATEVMAELKASQDAFAAAAATVPEEKFEDGRAAYRIIHLTGIEHYADHEPAIREWRKSQGI